MPEEKLDSAVDSLSRQLGFRNYEQFRVLASPVATRDLRTKAAGYAMAMLTRSQIEGSP